QGQALPLLYYAHRGAKPVPGYLLHCLLSYNYSRVGQPWPYMSRKYIKCRDSLWEPCLETGNLPLLLSLIFAVTYFLLSRGVYHKPCGLKTNWEGKRTNWSFLPVARSQGPPASEW